MLAFMFTLGAINALIPLIIIIILIVAAAGSTRGGNIFEMFGIASLLGIGGGSKGTLTGKKISSTGPIKKGTIGKATVNAAKTGVGAARGVAGVVKGTAGVAGKTAENASATQFIQQVVGGTKSVNSASSVEQQNALITVGLVGMVGGTVAKVGKTREQQEGYENSLKRSHLKRYAPGAESQIQNDVIKARQERIVGRTNSLVKEYNLKYNAAATPAAKAGVLQDALNAYKKHYKNNYGSMPISVNGFRNLIIKHFLPEAMVASMASDFGKNVYHTVRRTGKSPRLPSITSTLSRVSNFNINPTHSQSPTGLLTKKQAKAVGSASTKPLADLIDFSLMTPKEAAGLTKKLTKASADKDYMTIIAASDPDKLAAATGISKTQAKDLIFKAGNKGETSVGMDATTYVRRARKEGWIKKP